ncbi:MAG: flavin reductase family protein [Anaerolineae bacterium]
MTSPHSTIDPREFRNTLGRFATGITVITTHQQGEIIGMTANAFISVSLEPPLILVSVDKKAHMHQALLQAERYGVSMLAEGQQSLSNHFAGRPENHADVRFEERHGMPVVAGSIAYIVARIVEAHPAGDHTLFIGEVEFLEHRPGNPLLYYGGQYRHLPGEND